MTDISKVPVPETIELLRARRQLVYERQQTLRAALDEAELLQYEYKLLSDLIVHLERYAVRQQKQEAVADGRPADL